MRKFNLTFKGGILPGYTPEQARARLAKFFGIDDPQRVERFFSGDLVILRRNLDRKEGGDLFRKLRELGLETELVTVSEDPEDISPTPRASAATPEKTVPGAESPQQTAEKPAARETRGMIRAIRRQQPGQIDQSWAVPSRPAKARPGKASLSDLKKAGQERRESDDTAARRRAEEEERQRKAAEDAARRKAEEEERKRKVAEDAARRKAEYEERQRKAAEDAARRRAEEEERQRKAAQEAARRKAEEEERQRKAAEEAARRKAEEEERQRKAAEEAARRRAEEEERQRKAAEEAARRKAEEKRRREEAAARRRAEKAAEEQKRREEKEAAQRAAREAAEKRRAEREEAQRRAREEAARRKAEKEAARQAAREQAAREKARKAAARRQAAAEAAERKAREKEQRLLAAAEAARREAEEEHRRAEEAARLQAEREALRAEQERERQAQEARDQQAREEQQRTRKLEEDRKRAEAQAAKREARERAEKERAAKQHAIARQKAEQEAEARAAEQSRRDLEEKTVAIAARKLAGDAGVPVRQPAVRSKLDLPRRGPVGGGRRQPGAPNLFALHPFRATADIRQRSQRASQRWLLGTACALLTAVALLALGNYYRLLPPPAIPTGPEAMTSDPAGNLYLWAGDTLYLQDRAGVGMREITAAGLQVDGPIRALGWLPGEGLLMTVGSSLPDPDTPLTTRVCQLETNRCNPRWSGINARSITEHARTGTRYLVSARDGRLIKVDAAGNRLADAAVAAPVTPVLRLQDGLLFMNSAEGPAIGVFSPDDKGFGRQLDQILLLPPGAIEAGQDRVVDFIYLAETWWVVMANADGDSPGVYRFDGQWNLLGALQLPTGFAARAILDWNGRVLLLDPSRPQLPRFNREGAAEAALAPDALLASIEQARHQASLIAQAWRTGLALLALLCAAAVLYAYLQRIRSRVYRRGTPRGAEPIDSVANAVTWLAPAQNRDAHFRRLGVLLGIATLGGLIAGIGLRADASQLAALLVLAGATALALYLLYRSAPGHLGASGENLVIVDHLNHYHMGAGPRVMYRNSFVMIDDILLFTGNGMLPVFDAAQLAAVRPTVEAGIRVERKVIWVHLLQSRHPMASAFLVLLGGAGTAIALLAG